MLFRTAVIAALLAVTPALATLNERNVEEPVELNIRSDIDEEALLARDVEDLERRFGILKGIKAAFKIGKAINGAVHHHNSHKHHKRDLDSEELFERDLDSEELFERDFDGDEELFERDFDDETLSARDVEELERRFGILKGIKAAFKIGKAINGAVHHHNSHKHHKRDLDSEELFERDLDSEELFERDFDSEELFERDLESEELFERDFGDLDELD